MGIVRHHLNIYTDDDFLKGSYEKPDGAEWDVQRVQYFLYGAGSYTGSSWWLYDSNGEAIRNKAHLDNVLNKWKCLYEDEHKINPYKDEKIWITKADVHF